MAVTLYRTIHVCIHIDLSVSFLFALSISFLFALPVAFLFLLAPLFPSLSFSFLLGLSLSFSLLSWFILSSSKSCAKSMVSMMFTGHWVSLPYICILRRETCGMRQG